MEFGFLKILKGFVDFTEHAMALEIIRVDIQGFLQGLLGFFKQVLDGFLDAGSAAARAAQHLVDLDDGPGAGRVVATFEVDELHDYRARRPAVSFVVDRYQDYDAPRLVVRLLHDTGGTPYLLLQGPEPDIRWEGFARAVREVVELAHLHTVEDDPDDALDHVATGIAAGDVADILFTSGTTGQPKGAMSAHHQSIGVARAWAELGGVRQDDRYLVVNPFFHSFGYKIGILVGLLTGATLYPMATFDLDETMRLIETERITVLPGAPTIYQSLLGAPGREDRDLSSLRLAVTGAAVVPVVLIERMRAAAPEGLGIDQVVTAFGMTEAVVVTMARDGDPAELVASTCGRAIPGMETRIAAPADDGSGELLVRGDFVMLGYLDDPEATAEAIDSDGWLHTGDVGVLDDAGNLRITDRLKDMYISGGFNVYPAEVEQSLMRLEGLADVAVVGVPDERMGEVGKAFVVRADSPAGEALTADDVTAFAREHLANFKVPRQVEFTGALPRNLSGKVLKKDLR